METKRIEGRIEQVNLDKTRNGNDFVKVIIDTGKGKRTINIFDMKLYDKDIVSKGEQIVINCIENEWTTDDGQTRTSLIADSVEGVQRAEAPLNIPKDESSVELIMKKCLEKFYELLKELGVKEGIEFTPEDVRTVGVSLFIEACRRMK